MEEREEFHKRPSMAKKAGCQGLRVTQKRRSWAILERWLHALALDFSNPSFSPGRLALKYSKSARPYSKPFGRKSRPAGQCRALRLRDWRCCPPSAKRLARVGQPRVDHRNGNLLREFCNGRSVRLIDFGSEDYAARFNATRIEGEFSIIG